MNWLRGFALFAAGILIGTLVTRSSAAQENRITGLRLNHVGIAVNDMQKTLDFFTKNMGFKVAYAFPSPDGKPTTTFVQISRDTFIEVAPATANLPAGTITHMGMWTDNAANTVTQLRQAGTTATDVRPSPQSGSKLSNVTDPNGIRIELNEQGPDSLMGKAMAAWK